MCASPTGVSVPGSSHSQYGNRCTGLSSQIWAPPADCRWATQTGASSESGLNIDNKTEYYLSVVQASRIITG